MPLYRGIDDRDSQHALPVEGATLPVVVPNRWQGEADSLVGPFSGHEVAAYFANRLVDFGQFEVFTMRVFPRRNAWYVEVRPRRPAPRATTRA